MSAQETFKILIVLHILPWAYLCCLLISPGLLQKPCSSLLEPLFCPGHLVQVSISQRSLSWSHFPALNTGGRSNSLAWHTGPFKNYPVTLLLPASCHTAPYLSASSHSLRYCPLLPLHSTYHTQKIPGADQMASFISSLLCIFPVPSICQICVPIQFPSLWQPCPHRLQPAPTPHPLPCRLSGSPEHARLFPSSQVSVPSTGLDQSRCAI